MQKQTKKLDEKVNEITTTYKQLQKTQFYIVKKTLIGSLRKLCLQGLDIVDHQKVTTETIRKKKQIQDMLKKCNQIEAKVDNSEKVNPQIGTTNNNRTYRMSINYQDQQLQQKQQTINKPQLTQQQIFQKKSRQVAKSIIFHQLQSQSCKITTQQLDQLAKRIQTNNQVMKQIHMMVIQQGGNLQKIQQQIQDTYNAVKDANVELQKAAEIQHKNRVLKIRLGVSGFLGAIGMKILGIPGLIFGFFSGMIATK